MICACCGQPINQDDAEAIAFRAKLTPHERIIFLTVVAASPQPAPIVRIADALYGADPQGGPDWARGCIKLRIWHANKKLAAEGIKLSGRDSGYGALGGYQAVKQPKADRPSDPIAEQLERAAVVCDQRVREIVGEVGDQEPDTGEVNLPDWAETACEELEAAAARIRALNKPDRASEPLRGSAAMPREGGQ